MLCTSSGPVCSQFTLVFAAAVWPFVISKVLFVILRRGLLMKNTLGRQTTRCCILFCVALQIKIALVLVKKRNPLARADSLLF